MSGLQNFVKGNRNGQADSAPNGQLPVNPVRHAVAANARVQMKPHIARPPTAKGPRVRGEEVAHNQSIRTSQQQRPSGESRKHNPWDTDEGSIDTTINESVIQVENTQQHEYQPLQLHNEESEAGGDEFPASDELEDELEDDEGIDLNNERLIHYFAEHEMANATEEEQMQFLQESQPQLFRTIDGDSYPTTTDGNPTEWDEQKEPRTEDPASPSLSSRLLPQGLSATLSNQQLLHNPAANSSHTNPTVPQNSTFWQKSVQIREQQRSDNAVHAHAQSIQQHTAAHPPTSQPPSYSQATDEHHPTAPSTTLAGVEGIPHAQSGLSRRSGRAEPGHTQNLAPRIVEPEQSFRQASTTRTQVVPIFQQHVEPAPVSEGPAFLEGDYEFDVLADMEYDDLRDESFDKNPCERDPVLPKEMREKPLSERLQFVQHELDPTKQSEFFSALPTSEWEDAGDWFLDQFSAIVKKTREARQKKRRAAQDLEREIEERHQHIAQKQRLVKDAMVKMQAQGEGLVPKSPRASKSPRPRRA